MDWLISVQVYRAYCVKEDNTNNQRGQKGTGCNRQNKLKICNSIALLQGTRFAKQCSLHCGWLLLCCTIMSSNRVMLHPSSSPKVGCCCWSLGWAIAEESCFMFCVPNVTRLIVITLSPSTDFDCDPRLTVVSPSPVNRLDCDHLCTKSQWGCLCRCCDALYQAVVLVAAAEAA